MVAELIKLMELVRTDNAFTRDELSQQMTTGFGEMGKQFVKVLEGQDRIYAAVQQAIKEIQLNRKHIHDVKRLVIEAQHHDIPWLFVLLPDAEVKRQRPKYLTLNQYLTLNPSKWLTKTMRVHLICNGPDGKSPHFLHESQAELDLFFKGYRYDKPRDSHKRFGLAIKIAVGAACLSLTILTAGAAVPALAAAVGLSGSSTVTKEGNKKVAAEVNKRVFEKIVTSVANDIDATGANVGLADEGDASDKGKWPTYEKLKEAGLELVSCYAQFKSRYLTQITLFWPQIQGDRDL